jgi:hypothetical protein
MAEMYQVGGLDIFVHKYLGPQPHGDDSSSQTGGTQDATQPAYSYTNPLFVEDLLEIANMIKTSTSCAVSTISRT